MPQVPYTWSRDPTYGEVLGTGDITVLWGSLALGPLLLVVGALLGLPVVDGGFGLSTAEVIIVTFLGVGSGALVLAAGSWASAIVAVPGGLMLRPSFGTVGGGVVSVLVSALLVGWAGYEFHVGAEALDEFLEIAGLGGSDLIGWVAAGVVVVSLILAGPVLATRWWLRWFALIAALVLTVVWFVGLGFDGGFSVGVGEVRFVPALDLMVTVPILLFPLVMDIGRFSGAPTEASRVVALSYAAPALILILLGARVGVVSGSAADPVDLLVSAVGSSLGAVAAAFGAVWVVTAFLDQPFGYLQSAGADAESLFARIPQRIAALALLAPAVLVAFLVEAGDLLSYYQLMVSILVPIVAVFCADFFVVRGRSYLADALYERGGVYRGVNIVGVALVILAVMVFQWLTPSGPPWFADWVRDIIPNDIPVGERYDLPVGVAVFAATFLVYSVLGRVAVRDRVAVSRISGRF
ncbi:MAG: cytosine permease [Acidimicrobiia bacterium]|nr:cytosine permease [Acidimicrobiia bacterium]